MYNWGYLKNAALAKLDLDTQVGTEEVTNYNFVNRFHIYANEVITQVCSAIKPKRTFFEVDTFDKFEIKEDGTYVDNVKVTGVTLSADGKKLLDNNNNVLKYKLGTLITMPSDFISFGDDVCTILSNGFLTECHDNILLYKGYNQIICTCVGTYNISYNARWYTFTSSMSETTDLSFIPMDILDCIPSYIAHQCYKIDDEYKSAVYRNEYELFLSRIDDTNFKTTKTFSIGGDW